jgi:hypothetical protein
VFSSHGFEVWLTIEPWPQLIDVAVGMTLDDPGENVGEVRHRINVVELAGLDERSDGGPMLGAATDHGRKGLEQMTPIPAFKSFTREPRVVQRFVLVS